MKARRFAFRWRIPGAVAEVYEIVSDAARYPEWWGSSFATSRMTGTGGTDPARTIIELSGGPGAPLRLGARISPAGANPPHAVAAVLDGDVQGECAWRLRQDGPYVNAELECAVTAAGTGVHRLWFALAPLAGIVFRAAMRQGELGLRLELRRRHAVTAHERAMIPRLAGAGSGGAHATDAGDVLVAGALLRALPDETGETVG